MQFVWFLEVTYEEVRDDDRMMIDYSLPLLNILLRRWFFAVDGVCNFGAIEIIGRHNNP